mmetsp:Transcript_68616/g.200786  ORF Transcript_68616/g.200786 Transcript_68616/m.200786 type:complete len:398 (-) Transcript_68616:132-1325(-)
MRSDSQGQWASIRGQEISRSLESGGHRDCSGLGTDVSSESSISTSASAAASLSAMLIRLSGKISDDRRWRENMEMQISQFQDELAEERVKRETALQTVMAHVNESMNKLVARIDTKLHAEADSLRERSRRTEETLQNLATRVEDGLARHSKGLARTPQTTTMPSSACTQRVISAEATGSQPSMLHSEPVGIPSTAWTCVQTSAGLRRTTSQRRSVGGGASPQRDARVNEQTSQPNEANPSLSQSQELPRAAGATRAPTFRSSPRVAELRSVGASPMRHANATLTAPRGRALSPGAASVASPLAGSRLVWNPSPPTRQAEGLQRTEATLNSASAQLAAIGPRRAPSCMSSDAGDNLEDTAKSTSSGVGLNPTGSRQMGMAALQARPARRPPFANFQHN